MSDTYYCALDGTPFEADWSVRCECTRCMPLDAPDPLTPKEQAWAAAFTAYQKALSEPYFDQDDESRQSNRQEVERCFDVLKQPAEEGA